MHKFFLNGFLIFIILIISQNFYLYSSPALNSSESLNIPSLNTFTVNKEIVRPFKNRQITVAEYITDPIILYISLWGCFGITLPLWETSSAETGWKPDDERGFNRLRTYGGDVFLSRLKLEPFATGRVEPVTKVWNGSTVFRKDMYAKNIIEPIYFSYIGLYLRAKDYHPAIMITEIVLLSFLYEFTIRPFYTNSSFEQLLKNPGISILFSIMFDELSTFLLTTPYKGLHVLAYILNPFNALPNSRIHPMLFFDPYRKTANIEAIIKIP